ncbi:DUF6004 family protein [Streptomyces sp. NPDC048506]
METYESLNLEPKPIRPHILAAATTPDLAFDRIGAHCAHG